MAAQNKGIIARFLEGSEKSEDYARSTLPTNRWQAFFDILKGRLGKLCIINLLIIVFFAPILFLIVTRLLYIVGSGTIYPFGSNLGVGYPAAPDLTGVAESLMLTTDLLFYGAFVLCGFIAAIGLAGGSYVIRNMIWTEGVFVAHDFWKGIGKNYVNALQATLLCTIFLFLTKYLCNLADYMIAIGVGSVAWLTVAKVACYVVLAFAIMVSLWILALGVSYKQGFWQIFSNAFILTAGTLPQSVFFCLCAALPLAFFLLGDFFVSLGIVCVLLIGLSFALLVWFSFAQWTFDKYVNPKLGIAVNRGLYVKKESEEETSEAVKEYNRSILARGRSQLASRPMKPIDDGRELYELPEAFSREDLARLRQSRKEMIEDADSYAEEHRNDERYVEYNKMWDEREKVLQDDDKKGKKKKRPKMLNGK